MFVKDVTNNIEANIEFLEKPKKGIIGSILGKKKESSILVNEVKISIFKNGKEDLENAGMGFWGRYLLFNNMVYWKWTEKGAVLSPIEKCKILPSSSFRRKEIYLILDKKYSEADK